MSPMMPPMPPDQGAPPMDPSMMGQPGAPDPASGPGDPMGGPAGPDPTAGQAPPDQGMMAQLQAMMQGGQGGGSTDPQAILQALAQMAQSDQDQLAMVQHIEQLHLEESQKQAMIQALQAMIQQLSQDAHVAAGPDAAAPAPDALTAPQTPAPAEMLPQGISRMSGEPIPDPNAIPPGY